jgi:hypothetical protein
MEVTIRRLTKAYSQEASDRYVAQQVRAMTKARAKGHRDFKAWSDADIKDCAEKLARYYTVGEVWR